MVNLLILIGMNKIFIIIIIDHEVRGNKLLFLSLFIIILGPMGSDVLSVVVLASLFWLNIAAALEIRGRSNVWNKGQIHKTLILLA